MVQGLHTDLEYAAWSHYRQVEYTRRVTKGMEQASAHKPSRTGHGTVEVQLQHRNPAMSAHTYACHTDGEEARGAEDTPGPG